MSSPVRKYAPKSVLVVVGRGGVEAPVIRYEALPPHTHPDSGIREKCWLLRMHTAHGVRMRGFANCYIDASLRMVCELSPGQERDEVLMRWEDVPPTSPQRPSLEHSSPELHVKPTEKAVPVVFRVDKEGEVVAVFGDLTCYAHVGQHSSCTYEWYRSTRPATPAQYVALKRELRTQGYSSLRVLKRLPART